MGASAKSEKNSLRYEEKAVEEVLHVTINSIDSAVIAVDRLGHIVMLNSLAETITGWDARSAVGRPFKDVYITLDEDSRQLHDFCIAQTISAEETHPCKDSKLLLAKDGQEILIEDYINILFGDADGQIGAVITFRDVTEKRKMQKQIEKLYYYDFLTNVYNRRYIEEAIQLLDVEKSLPISIMSLDVNALKLTNDAFGHETGDRLLVEVSNSLKKICRSSDIISRIGGDEFCILLPRTDQRAAKKIKDRINQHISKIQLGSVFVSIAIGVATKVHKEECLQKIRLDSDSRMYKDKMTSGKTMRRKIIDMLVKKNNEKFSEEKRHKRNVAFYCKQIAMAMSLGEKAAEEVRLAGEYHDIGKVILPEGLLEKKSPLTTYERELIKKHSESGYHILKSVDQYLHIAEVILYHHERWDGTGYPAGKKEEEIPLYSRIINVADAYDAMTSPKAYREIMSKKEAIEELIRCSGTQFDPQITEIFINKVLNHNVVEFKKRKNKQE